MHVCDDFWSKEYELLNTCFCSGAFILQNTAMGAVILGEETKQCHILDLISCSESHKIK